MLAFTSPWWFRGRPNPHMGRTAMKGQRTWNSGSLAAGIATEVEPLPVLRFSGHPADSRRKRARPATVREKPNGPKVPEMGELERGRSLRTDRWVGVARYTGKSTSGVVDLLRRSGRRGTGLTCFRDGRKVEWIAIGFETLPSCRESHDEGSRWMWEREESGCDDDDHDVAGRGSWWFEDGKRTATRRRSSRSSTTSTTSTSTTSSKQGTDRGRGWPGTSKLGRARSQKVIVQLPSCRPGMIGLRSKAEGRRRGGPGLMCG